MQFKTLQTSLFISLIVIATALFVWLINDYLQPIFWALVLAILFHPLYVYFRHLVKGHASIASLLTITVVLVVVFAPLYVLGALVAQEAVGLYYALAQNGDNPSTLVQQLYTTLAPLERIGIDVPEMRGHIITFVQNFSAQIGIYALDIGRATANTIIGILLTLYILFFALRDGEHIVTRVVHALPLGDVKEKMLMQRFADIVHAMFKGTFIIALIQGIIGGMLFLAVGIPSAALWAFVMALFALIPAVGPAIVWLPAGILLLVSGAIWQGVTVLVVGVIVISVIDNLLRPILIGKDAAMPDVLILLSVLGGLSLFGIAGLIIGPVITAFFISMWQLFEHDYATDLETHG